MICLFQHEKIDFLELDFNDRPNEYLRERCPLCFGGENWSKPSEKYVYYLLV